ncbi:MAG: MFS transporter [Thermoleophilaceae bacterium]|nr:MFS transporter [Thermoleophilaceae bacterium]
MEIARRHALQRHTLRVLVGAQLLSGAGLAAGIVAGALLAEEMIGSTSGAGLPSALFTLGAAGSAFLIGQVSQARGRRVGLAGGYFIGAIGGAGIVAAAAIDSVPLLLASLLVYGAGTASSFQARYAGADLAAADARAKAVSIVLVATTAGAVAGPLLTQLTGDFAESVGVIALAGPFMLAAVAYFLASIVLWAFLRPDPLLTARSIEDGSAGGAADDPEELDSHGVRVAVSVMVLVQFVMVAVMTMTPIHMRDHDHSLTATGAVIAMHVAAMFLPSPVTGVLVDSYGRHRMIAASAITLVSAGLLAAVAPPESMALLSLALILLGLGWNFGVVSGTALLTDSTPLAQRASVQGRADLLVQLSGAAGGLGSGFVMASTGYATLALIGGGLSLLMIPLMFAARRREVRPT